MPVRNEDWILGLSLRVALKWCDEVIVALHHCTDKSLELVADLCSETDRLSYILIDGSEWAEMTHRQRLLECARKNDATHMNDATHIALIDADEVLTANLLPSIRQAVNASKPGWMLDLPLYNVRNCEQYHTNGVWGNRWVATAFLDQPQLHWAGDCFHHREPFGVNRWYRDKPVDQGFGGVMHFWGASERRLRAKHALYRITERLKWPDKDSHLIEYTYDPATNPESELARRMGVAGPWTVEALKPEWIEPYAELMQHLHIDAEPWQEAEVRRILAEHGREHFAGLDLLGL